MNPRTVLFGGTFDPVHNAHLEIARAAKSRFGLQRVLFVPAANPPHKSHGAQASYEDRVRMLELACANEPEFEVSRIEETSGMRPNYSSDAIEKLGAEKLGSEKLRAGGSEALSFLIGADAFAEITTWH